MTAAAEHVEAALPPKLVLRVKEAAAALGVGEREVRRLCRTGELGHFVTSGRQYRVPTAALEEYVQRITIAPRS